MVAPGVQQNDTDPENGDLSVTLLQATDHGSLTLNENGSFRYTHDGSETTQDSFRYQITDNLGKTDTATVTITIQPINDAPVAIADSYSVSSRETLTVNSPGLLANDSDEDNENLSAILVDNVTRGTLTLRPDGSFTYTNNAGIEDAFSYLVSDGTIESAAVVVTIDVLTINVPGDLDGNGDVTIEDVNLLSEAIKGSSEDQTFDLSSDGKVDLDDLDILILEILGTYYGDANLDGQFDSSDLVSAFQAGEYEDSIANNSTWSEGDWNSDGDFTTADLVKSFQSGAYEQAAAARAVTPTNLGAALTVERAGDFRDQLTFKEPPSHGTNEGMRKTNIDLQNRDLLFAEDGFVNFELESRSGDLSDDLLDSINNDF